MWHRAVLPLIRHGADFFLHFGSVDHDDGVPRAAIQKAAIGTFAQTLLAANTKQGINLNAAEGRMVFVGNPEHAILDRAVFHARRRTGATRAAFSDDGEFFWFLLARGGDALGARFVLELIRDQPRRFHFGRRRHSADYTLIS